MTIKLRLHFLLLLSLFGFVLHGQTIPDPDFAFRPYELQSDGSLKSLDRSSATTDMKVKGLYRGSEIYLTVFGITSKATYDQNEIPRIFIKLSDNSDPYEAVTVVKGEVVKDRRRFLQRNQALGGKAKDISDVFIQLEFKRIKENLWEVFLPEDINPGEYAFMPVLNVGEGMDLSYSATTYLSCFSITGEEYTPSTPVDQPYQNTSGTSPKIKKESYQSEASGPSVGIKAGFGASRGTFWGPLFIPSFLVGVQAEFPVFKDYLSIRTGGEFHKLGGKDPINIDAFHLYYLRIPGLLKGGYRFQNDMKVFACLGPNFGIGLAGTLKNGGRTSPIFRNNYSRFDVGIAFELGLEINRKMSVAMSTLSGVVDFDQTLDIEKNRSIVFTFNYNFGQIKLKEKQTQPAPVQTTIYEKQEVVPVAPAKVTCQVCNGTGSIQSERNAICSNQCDKGLLQCSTCQGSGKGKSLGNKFNPSTQSIEQIFEECQSCEGSGLLTCPVCKGKGIELIRSTSSCTNCNGNGKL